MGPFDLAPSHLSIQGLSFRDKNSLEIDSLNRAGFAGG
jgi:hypothetical protein